MNYEKLIEAFQNAFISDDESFESVGEDLVTLYESANQQEKEFMDRVFVCLCGYKFSTLLEGIK
jgi:hypothetical protein